MEITHYNSQWVHMKKTQFHILQKLELIAYPQKILKAISCQNLFSRFQS